LEPLYKPKDDFESHLIDTDDQGSFLTSQLRQYDVKSLAEEQLIPIILSLVTT